MTCFFALLYTFFGQSDFYQTIGANHLLMCLENFFNSRKKTCPVSSVSPKKPSVPDTIILWFILPSTSSSAKGYKLTTSLCGKVFAYLTWDLNNSTIPLVWVNFSLLIIVILSLWWHLVSEGRTEWSIPTFVLIPPLLRMLQMTKN